VVIGDSVSLDEVAWGHIYRVWDTFGDTTIDLVAGATAEFSGCEP
jgi:hypothetical protein